MNKNQLVNLCSRTWSLTALGLMASGVKARVSPLAAAANCGRNAMGASIEHLIELELLERNPGHGHPLRPEFRLTHDGEALADWAAELAGIIRKDTDRALLRTKWSLPLINCLHEEKRYSDLRRELKPVTDRALSNCLSNLTENAWLKRNVNHQISPPTVAYQPVKLGLRIQDHLMEFPNLVAA